MSERKLTGLRVQFPSHGATGYGVARVRYETGHMHAGHYEVQRADGTALLVPWANCEPAPNWDVAPMESQFAGTELYIPQYRDTTGRQFMSTGSGVLVPGDGARLKTLVGSVREGDTVGWYSHGCNEFRGELTVARVDADGMAVTGHPKAPVYAAWPDRREEFEITDGLLRSGGTTLRIYRVPERRTGKHRESALDLTFRFPADREWRKI